eukprot:7966551-Pyramimonas_sp.AAC.1
MKVDLRWLCPAVHPAPADNAPTPRGNPRATRKGAGVAPKRTFGHAGKRAPRLPEDAACGYCQGECAGGIMQVE